MGKQIHLKKILRLFEKSSVVDFKSIERIVGIDKKSYAKLLVSNLLKSSRIKKLGKGFYTVHDESSLAVFAFSPAYIGLQSALSFYGVWEQETIPVILTQKKVRRGIRNVLDSNVLVRNISKRFFFGFDFFKEGDFYLPYSDLEKTLIDMVIFNQKIDSEVLKKITKKIRFPVLKKYLSKCGKKLKNKVLAKLNC